MRNTTSVMDSVRSLYLGQEALYSASLELTYGCGLNCFHCYNAEKNRKELSTREIFLVLEQLAELRCLYLTLTGGEPHFRKDLPAIVQHARDLGFAVTIFSNGTNLKAKVLDKIEKSGVLKYCVSLYSLNPAVHDSITGTPGSLRKTQKGLKQLVDRHIKVQLKCLVTKKNFHEYGRVVQFARKNGFDCEVDYNLLPSSRAGKSIITERLDNSELEALLAEIKTIRPPREKTNNPISLTKQRKFHGETQVLCDAGTTTLGINPYGDVFPCIHFTKQAGNVKNDTLKSIWRNSPVLWNLRRIRMENLTQCSKCRHLSYCARCPALALIEQGAITAPVQFACQAAEAYSRVKENG